MIRSLQSRIMAVAMLPVIVLAVLLGGYMISQRQDDLEQELQHRGQLLARQLAAASDYGVFSNNLTALQALADSVAKERAVAGTMIVDRDGRSLVRSGSPGAVPSAPGAAPSIRSAAARLVFSEPIRTPRILVEDVEPASAEVQREAEPGVAVGTAIVELSTVELENEKTRFAVTVGAMLLSVLLGAWWVARRMSGRVSRPILQVAQAVERIGRGETGVRVEPSHIGVLNQLGSGFNEMASRLEHSLQDLEDRVAAATRELVEKKNEAEEANEAKTRFLAAASHDLRQPIHALGMFVAALAQRAHARESRRLVGQIETAVGAMGDLLDSLLDISRLDAGTIKADVSAFPLQPLFERLRSEFSEAAEAKGLEMTVRNTTAWVRSDRILLERILANLLSNSIRYTQSGRVMLAARKAGEALRIEVRDSGVGFPQEAQEAIFQEFVQLGNPERDRSKGLGLGLAIVQRLASLLEHPLVVRSRPGQGAVFGIVVPRSAVLATAREEPAAPVDGLTYAGIRVLVVDDDALVRESLSSLLSAWGCNVVLASGDEALPGRLNAEGIHPDLILCDLRLADGLDGLALIKSLREVFGRGIPAAIITGDNDPQTIRSASETGDPVLQKPVRPAQLRALLRTMLRRRDQRTAFAPEP